MQVYQTFNNDELSEFIYIPNFFDKAYTNEILAWIQKLYFIKGIRKNGINIDREQIWYENNNNYFCKVWKTRHERWEATPYDDFLTNIQDLISARTNIEINSCLINKYNNGNDIISPHKDNMVSFGKTPDIIIYSLGCSRQLKVNHDLTKEELIFNLEPNSIFIMRGGSQKYYTHEITKSDTKETRYSLTFRKYIDN